MAYEFLITHLNDLATNAQEQIKRHNGPWEPRSGDVVGVVRAWGAYFHYGVFVSHDEVIHYTSLDSDVGENNQILSTDFRTFLRGEQEFFILDFPEQRSKPKKIEGLFSASSGFITHEQYWEPRDYESERRDKIYKKYSREETVARARSKIGENSYDLWGNNCEHFAFWCATGVHESPQADEVKKFLRNNLHPMKVAVKY